MGGQLSCSLKNIKAVIIPQIIYRAFIRHPPTREKRNRKTLVLQLARVQALGANSIHGEYKAISAEALNVEEYLTTIGLELDKRPDQTAIRLCSRLLYRTLTQSRSTNTRRILTSLEIFEKRYAKRFDNNICKVESKPAYIVAL